MKNFRIFLFVLVITALFSCKKEEIECDYIAYTGTESCTAGNYPVPGGCCPENLPYYCSTTQNCYNTCEAADKDCSTSIYMYNSSANNGGGSGSSKFDGIWENSSGTLAIKGSSTQFTFYKAETTNWKQALERGFISIGSQYLRNFKEKGTNVWSCEVLWNERTDTEGVIAVKWISDSEIKLINNGTELFLTSTSDGTTLTGSFYKK
jgi:hypothetical protein